MHMHLKSLGLPKSCLGKGRNWKQKRIWILHADDVLPIFQGSQLIQLTTTIDTNILNWYDNRCKTKQVIKRETKRSEMKEIYAKQSENKKHGKKNKTLERCITALDFNSKLTSKPWPRFTVRIYFKQRSSFQFF